jgi:hypothetical protein
MSGVIMILLLSVRRESTGISGTAIVSDRFGMSMFGVTTVMLRIFMRTLPTVFGIGFDRFRIISMER